MWVMAQNKQNLVNVISGERLFVDDWSDIIGDYKLVYECRNCSEGVVLAEYKTEKQCTGALCELALELSELEKVVNLCPVNQCD